MQQQNTNFSNQQGIMQQPPVMVSTKDALYFNDMLSWNLLAMKKAHFYAEHCQDPALKTAFEQCGQMHQRHYEQVLKHLNTTQPFNNMQ
ncbi:MULTISPECIES: hypothetical protein [Cytobacillus]|uniref:Coat F domain-containing protein n=1 Tax=Cytobacillus stercorigallinarum TaxID=2762240 RepID=A0ABR8QVE5_9BACI|nr:hypothetical protein [Cytobacillus stercorigallinarum]MBD7939417.1 hypothetical protein [Cytobacillus stercorigallinarum]